MSMFQNCLCCLTNSPKPEFSFTIIWGENKMSWKISHLCLRNKQNDKFIINRPFLSWLSDCVERCTYTSQNIIICDTMHRCTRLNINRTALYSVLVSFSLNYLTTLTFIISWFSDWWSIFCTTVQTFNGSMVFYIMVSLSNKKFYLRHINFFLNVL